MTTGDYSGFQPCPTLTPRGKCVRLRQYQRGAYTELFHEHFKAHELSESVLPQLLWTLVLRYEESTARQIVQAHLTRRGRLAKTDHPLQVRIDHPEPGVVRRMCGGNISAWVDTVVARAQFRQEEVKS